MLLDFGAEQRREFLPKIFAEKAGLLLFEALENLLAFTVQEREAGLVVERGETVADALEDGW